MSITNTGGYATIDEVRFYSEPIRNYNFNMQINIPTGAAPNGTSNASTQMSLRCMSTTVPSRRLHAIPYTLSKFKIGVTGKMEYDNNWRCTILEGVDHTTLDTITIWMSQAFDPRTGRGLATDVATTGAQGGNSSSTATFDLTKGAAIITLLDTQDATLWSASLYGLFPIDIGAIELNYDQQELVRVDVTWWYDYWVTPVNT